MLPELARALLAAARAAGAPEAEAIVMRGTATSVDVRNAALESAERADAVELGLRVLIGGRQAVVSGADHRPDAIARMASRAVTMAREAPVDETLGLAEPEQLAARRDAEGLALEDPGPAPDPAELQDRALRAEAAARAVEGISQVEAASASFIRRDMWMAFSNGFEGGYARTQHATSCLAITGTGLGMERDHAAEGRAWLEDLPAPEEIGELAARRALARAGSRKPPTGRVSVLYDERVAASLISHLLSAANGAAIARGSSWLLRDLGAQVLPAAMDLTEDPHRPKLGASRWFDAEGLPTTPRQIVADGVLQGWALDLSYARRLGLASTGSAQRGVGAAPSPGYANIALTPGTQSRDGLIAEMGRGLVVTSLLGSSINPTTGDYSRGAAGFWVENGEIAYPVNECTIAGNLRDMLMGIVAANDADPWRGMSVPSLLVEGMTIAGA